MTPTQIGLIVIAVVAAIIVGSIVMQGIENQKRERRLRLLTIKDKIRRADHLVNALPAELKTQQIEQLLVKYLLDQWRELNQLDRTVNVSSQIQQLTELAKNSKTQPMGAAGLTLFPALEQARNAKAIVREVGQFLGDLQKAGRIPPQQVQPILNQIKISHARAGLDVQLFQAKEIEQNSGPSVALHQYRSCERTMEKLSRYAPMESQINALQNLIMNCEVALEQEQLKREAEFAAEHEAQKNPKPLN